MSRVTSADSGPRGTWVAVGAAITLLLGRALLWLVLQLIKVLLVLAVVAMIFAIGFGIGQSWDTVIGAPVKAEIPSVAPIHHE
jgi:hypothetical protein